MVSNDQNHIESMDSPLELIWNWAYEIEHSRLEDLYRKAKRNQPTPTSNSTGAHRSTPRARFSIESAQASCV